MLLTSVLIAPLVGLLVLLAIPAGQTKLIKLWANFASLVGALLTLPLCLQFNQALDFQFVEKRSWIPTLGASYHLGLDGISLVLVVLTGFVTFLALVSSWSAIEVRVV